MLNIMKTLVVKRWYGTDTVLSKCMFIEIFYNQFQRCSGTPNIIHLQVSF